MFRLCTCAWHLHFGPTFRGRCSLFLHSRKSRISAPTVSIYDARSFGWLIKLITELESSSRMLNSEDHTGSCSIRLANRIKKSGRMSCQIRVRVIPAVHMQVRSSIAISYPEKPISKQVAKLLESCSNISSIAQNYSRRTLNFLQLSKNSI